MYLCISDRYDRDGDTPYESVADFNAMCLACYGEAPVLHRRHDGTYADDKGVVLEPYADDDAITTLRTEAATAGDTEQVDLCNLALDGDEAARAECARVIAEAHPE